MEPSWFGNGWQSGEAGAQGHGVTVVRKRGRPGQTLCRVGAFSNVGYLKGHDTVPPSPHSSGLEMRPHGWPDAGKQADWQADPAVQEVQAI